MLRSTSCAGAIAALASSAALAAPLTSAPLTSGAPAPDRDTLEVPAAAIAALGVQPESDGAWDVDAFSKDFCAPVVAGGVRFGECVDANGDIRRSIWLQNYTWSGKVASHNGFCSHGCDVAICLAPCDEVESGELTLTFHAILRDDAGDCCNYFGCWTGVWEYVTEDGRVYSGTADGTVGRGSNRATRCDLEKGDNCETCHEARPLNNGGWLIAFEGSFEGSDELGRSLCFTADGDWLVPGSCDSGPQFGFAISFEAEAALEGARLSPCVQ